MTLGKLRTLTTYHLLTHDVRPIDLAELTMNFNRRNALCIQELYYGPERAGHSSLVVKVAHSGLVCHEFQPRATEDLLCGGGRSTLNLSRLKRPPTGVVVRRRGFQLEVRPRQMTRFQKDEVRRQ
ncbi:hypothetical protein TNCV_1779111 [Trichonephila clavipes]|nr:hypothetical protein TNCV_1779111 [Trichonephila clavipes]